LLNYDGIVVMLRFRQGLDGLEVKCHFAINRSRIKNVQNTLSSFTIYGRNMLWHVVAIAVVLRLFSFAVGCWHMYMPNFVTPKLVSIFSVRVQSQYSLLKV